jgi:hypothetical protein
VTHAIQRLQRNVVSVIDNCVMGKISGQATRCTHVSRLLGAVMNFRPFASRSRGVRSMSIHFALLALIAAFWTCGSVTPAAAQFVCQQFGGTNGGSTASGAIPNGNVACGTTADASGNNSGNTAVGFQSNASGDNNAGNTANGRNSRADGNASANTASGAFADAHGDNSKNLALGNQSDAQGAGTSNVAIGDHAYANATAGGNVALGFQAAAGGQAPTNFLTNSGNVAIGSSAQAGTLVSGQIDNTALGQGAQANAIGSTAVGFGASANFNNSSAIGQGATVTRANQVAIGTGTNTYTLSGITSAASLSAQSGPTSFVTTDANGNLATSTFNPASLASLQPQITSLQSQVTSLQSQVLDNRMEARTGTAVALAAGSMPALQPGRKFALSAGYGNFEGANAFGIGATALLYDGKGFAIVGNVGGAVGIERSAGGGRGAVSVQW